jgi:hypothetical protein
MKSPNAITPVTRPELWKSILVSIPICTRPHGYFLNHGDGSVLQPRLRNTDPTIMTHYWANITPATNPECDLHNNWNN